jgi:hypothetical protein
VLRRLRVFFARLFMRPQSPTISAQLEVLFEQLRADSEAVLLNAPSETTSRT